MQIKNGLQRDFPITVEEMVAAAKWLDGIAVTRSLPGDTAHAMQLCLEELLGNTLRHAGPGRRAKVALRLFADRVEMTIEDDGRPFDIASAPVKHAGGKLEDLEPGGLGIGLVHDFSSKVAYARAGLGNRITLTFAFTPATPGASAP